MFLFISIFLLLEMPAAVLGVDLDQSPKVLVKEKGKTIFLPCKDNRQSSDYIHWYQVKDGQAPSRLLYISQGGSVAYDTNVKEAKDFTVDKKKLYDLKLSNTQTSHSAVYFCAYWDSSNHTLYAHAGWMMVFGSVWIGIIIALVFMDTFCMFV